jgi:ribosomal protein S18 acetylase RimI-like enzyme
MDGGLSCDASLVDAMRTMALFQETSLVELEEDGSILFVTGKSRFPSPYSNVAFPTASGTTAEDLLSRAKDHFPGRRFFVWARGPLAEKLEPLALASGFISFGTIPGMVVEARVDVRESPGIVVERATDSSGFWDFVRVSARAYAEAGLPGEIAESLLARATPALANSDIFVARSGDEPIAAAMSITNGTTGIAGVYWVGTVPDSRRRGAADAVTRAATNAAFDRGASVVTLQASELGEPVYLRMGYREVCRYARFLSPAVSR